MRPLVKVCGITLAEQAAALDALGVDFLGFIFARKSPRTVTAAQAAAMECGRARRVGVFVEHTPEAVARIMDQARLDLAQLHAGQDEAFCLAVGPHRVIKVFWPQRYASRAGLEEDMARFRHCCALMLLDSGISGGGHGTRLECAALTGLNAPRPWLLAGGLSQGNALQALARARPAGLDLNSGVEISPGVKDISKINTLLHSIQDF